MASTSACSLGVKGELTSEHLGSGHMVCLSFRGEVPITDHAPQGLERFSVLSSQFQEAVIPLLPKGGALLLLIEVCGEPDGGWSGQGNVGVPVRWPHDLPGVVVWACS